MCHQSIKVYVKRNASTYVKEDARSYARKNHSINRHVKKTCLHSVKEKASIYAHMSQSMSDMSDKMIFSLEIMFSTSGARQCGPRPKLKEKVRRYSMSKKMPQHAGIMSSLRKTSVSITKLVLGFRSGGC